ncbi:S1 family peptidase [Sphingobium cupriresistens]|uniref:S1 family peptidase n=1 Tax=Sphingobium cupriresistens TaxID=1132417 RepID=UPI003BADDA35
MPRLSDQLRYMTVRILTSKTNSRDWSGSGTGFFFLFERDDVVYPTLVTNKHVVDGAVSIGLTFHVTVDGNKSPLPGAGRTVALRANQLPIIRHPVAGVDLACIPLAGIMTAAQNEGWRPYIKCLEETHLPDASLLADLGSIEDILMVGYPTGIVDATNNFPVIRRGITSTPYAADYQGKKEFLADIPVYGGSSGSPIFLMNEGAYSTSDALVMGSRFALLGVLYAGHTETVNGHIVAEPIPSNLGPVAKVKHMINLGLCIKSSMLVDLGTELQRMPGQRISFTKGKD